MATEKFEFGEPDLGTIPVVTVRGGPSVTSPSDTFDDEPSCDVPGAGRTRDWRFEAK